MKLTGHWAKSWLPLTSLNYYVWIDAVICKSSNSPDVCQIGWMIVWINSQRLCSCLNNVKIFSSAILAPSGSETRPDPNRLTRTWKPTRVLEVWDPQNHFWRPVHTNMNTGVLLLTSFLCFWLDSGHLLFLFNTMLHNLQSQYVSFLSMTLLSMLCFCCMSFLMGQFNSDSTSYTFHLCDQWSQPLITVPSTHCINMNSSAADG